MPVKQVSFDRPVTRQEVERLQAMAKAMRERPKQQVGHPLQAAAVHVHRRHPAQKSR